MGPKRKLGLTEKRRTKPNQALSRSSPAILRFLSFCPMKGGKQKNEASSTLKKVEDKKIAKRKPASKEDKRNKRQEKKDRKGNKIRTSQKGLQVPFFVFMEEFRKTYKEKKPYCVVHQDFCSAFFEFPQRHSEEVRCLTFCGVEMRTRVLSNGLKWLKRQRGQSPLLPKPGVVSSPGTGYRQMPVFERNLHAFGRERQMAVPCFSRAFSSEVLVADKATEEEDAERAAVEEDLKNGTEDEEEADGAAQEQESRNNNLQKRLFRLVFPNRSAVKELQKWVSAGREVRKVELDRAIRELRRIHRYKHALEISEWMEDYKELQLSASDYAIRLDLISKVRGMASAEKYFEDLPEDAKTHSTYGALIHCYVREKLTENAVALLKKMQELGVIRNALPYNEIMALYISIGQAEKVPSVIEELKKNNVPLDAFSYNVWMSALSSMSDLNGVEKVCSEMKGDENCTADWTTYSTLASIYIKSGLVDEAKSALKEAEKLVTQKDRIAYDYLISMYTNLGDKDEVLRVWQSLKAAFRKMTNASYICVLSSLVKLGCVDEAEKIFDEWESTVSNYDVRVSNILLAYYMRNGLLEKAEIFQGRVIEKGGNPNYKSWEILVEGYLQSKQMDKAMVALKKAFSRLKSGEWHPNTEILTAFQKHYEEQGDVESAEEYLEVLRGVKCVNTENYNSLLRTYVKAGKGATDVLERMEKDNVAHDEETDVLLKQASESAE